MQWLVNSVSDSSLIHCSLFTTCCTPRSTTRDRRVFHPLPDAVARYDRHVFPTQTRRHASACTAIRQARLAIPASHTAKRKRAKPDAIQQHLDSQWIFFQIGQVRSQVETYFSKLRCRKLTRPRRPIQRAIGGSRFGSYQPSSKVTSGFRSRQLESAASLPDEKSAAAVAMFVIERTQRCVRSFQQNIEPAFRQSDIQDRKLSQTRNPSPCRKRVAP